MKSGLPAEIKKTVMQLDINDLIELNHMVVERIKQISKMRSISQMEKFSTGDRVSFDIDGRILAGTVVRLNQKTVSVDTDDGGKWKVAPGLLNTLIE